MNGLISDQLKPHLMSKRKSVGEACLNVKEKWGFEGKAFAYIKLGS